MSAQSSTKRLSITDIRARKGQTPIVVLTAYTEPLARILDPHADMLMVGDSLGMVLYGMDSTLPVSLELMIGHAAAVVRASSHACVVFDMPFASYQESKEQAFRGAARALAESGAQCVKLEGGEEMAETIEFLTARGIPVMGHVGLTPQHVLRFGGFKVQGREEAAAKKILADAKAVAEAGAFSIVIEGVVETLAAEITRAVAVPTVGIGASVSCDGQVLVSEDMLGLTPRAPKFVRRYADLTSVIAQAAASYADDVRNRRFPAREQCYE